tara:strand:+ start:181 stop:993 length:813 start_codon:yes stop_codon:yes gene_type:complete
MDNLRGALIMVLAMLGFAIEDSFIKLLAEDMPVGQIMGLLGIGAAAIFAVLVRAQDQALFPRAALSGPVLLRNAGELFGTLGFILAIALIPLSTASAILQATPLVVTLGAALFLGDPVGWRRWTAILVGFAGVLLVIRPGLEGFDVLSLFALQGVIGLAIRDLATRRVPATTSSMQLSFLAFLTLIPTARQIWRMRLSRFRRLRRTVALSEFTCTAVKNASIGVRRPAMADMAVVKSCACMAGVICASAVSRAANRARSSSVSANLGSAP